MHILSVIVEFAIVLGIMVLVHEFGHFAVAKLCGVRVEAFSIGFGPRLFGVRHNGTDYKVCLLPLGGYVKMAGEYNGDTNVTTTGAPDEFTSKTRWQRILIALAGPFANFVLSFLLLAMVAHYHHETDQYLNGPAVVDYVPLNTPAAHSGLTTGDTIVGFNNVSNPTWEQILEEVEVNLSNHAIPLKFLHNGSTVSASLDVASVNNGDFSPDKLGLIPRMQVGPLGMQHISAGSPAERAGLVDGDALARVDSVEIHSVQTLLAYLKDRNGAPATLLVVHKGQTRTVQLQPEWRDNGIGSMSFQVGFKPLPVPTDVEQLPLGSSLKQSLIDNGKDSTLILRVLKGLFTRHVSVKQMSGPVGIAQQIDIATQMGPWSVVQLMSAISLNLGIMNLLPFPILDGGMILFLIIESIMRRDVDMAIKERVYQVAFVCIILFACFVMFNDITKLHFGKP
jgi:regulator of sigma E protease